MGWFWLVCCLLEADIWFCFVLFCLLGLCGREDGGTVGRSGLLGRLRAIFLNLDLDLRGGGRVVSGDVGGGGCR